MNALGRFMGFKVSLQEVGLVTGAVSAVGTLIGSTFYKRPLVEYNYLLPGIESYAEPGTQEIDFHGAVELVKNTFDHDHNGKLSKEELKLAKQARSTMACNWFRNLEHTGKSIDAAVDFLEKGLEHEEYLAKKAAKDPHTTNTEAISITR